MIKFACTCHTVLEVSDEFAGSSLQCPKCKRLLDVPTLSDLQALTDEGTYKIDQLKLRDEPDRLAELHRAYARTRVDEHGNELDLREHFGPDSVPAFREDEVLGVLAEQPIAPKYDPVTGELVRGIPLKQEPVKFDPATIPMAKAVINYATGASLGQFGGLKIIPQLFAFQNVVVLGIIVLVHIFMQLILFPLFMGMLLVLPGFLFLLFAVLAHYANVVNDIAVANSDELPRPLRDLSWGDDIWGPFVHFLTAAFLCYGLLIFTYRLGSTAAFAYKATILILGTIAFPALFLTTATSGTILNLAPDRVLNVISAIGAKYVICVALWAVTAASYAAGMVESAAGLAAMITGKIGPPRLFGQLIPPVLSFPLLLLGIVLMHGFCWYLGLQYRAHHEDFHWFLQRHHRKVEIIHHRGQMAVAPPSAQPPVATAIPPPQPPPTGDGPQSHA